MPIESRASSACTDSTSRKRTFFMNPSSSATTPFCSSIGDVPHLRAGERTEQVSPWVPGFGQPLSTIEWLGFPGLTRMYFQPQGNKP